MELRDRVAVVTGGASGIGAALCRRFAAEGARGVVVADLDGAGAARVAAEIGGLAVATDVGDEAQVRALVDAAEARFGPIDLFVSNAGVALGGGLGALDAGPFAPDDAWRTSWDVNVMAHVYAARAVLPGMLERGFGRLVNVASDAGRVGSSGEAVYAACKGGIISFSKSVAREVARDGITLNVVSPGPTDTPLFASFDPSGKLASALERAIPMRRLGRPADYPGIVAFLLSDDAAFITGQTISVSGGLTMHG